MKEFKHILLAVCALLMFSSGVRAQFHWQVSHSDFDGKYVYSFDAISSSGNTCTAIGDIIDTSTKSIRRIFWNSTDAGVTWEMQDPGLPLLHYTANLNHGFLVNIQQIDSLNVVAVGDSGIILRTTDGGQTWEKQTCQNNGAVYDVHFSNSLTGIILLYAASEVKWYIYTTFDGGKNWELAPFTSQNIYSCYSRGGEGKFSIFKIPHGPIYSTKDRWSTVDSTKRFLDSLPNGSKYFFNYCNFTGGDTIIVYQAYTGSGAIMRSTNSGVDWEKPVFTSGVTAIDYMTPIGRDTVIASGRSDIGNKILVSTDRGITWRTDSLLLDTAYNAYRAKGLAFTSNGSCIAAYSSQLIRNRAVDPTILIHSNPPKAKVDWYGIVYYHQRIFPIPATSFLNIASVEDPMPYIIVDVLGREVMTGMLPNRNSIELDVSMLPRGVYYVLVDSSRGKVIIGKAILVGS